MLKRTILILLAAALLTLPCTAADADEAGVLDTTELDKLMAPYIEKHALNDENFGLAFLYTGTNESYFVNGDNYMYAASLFKVPLCMLVAEKVSSGELTQDGTFNQIPITHIEEACIIRSNNAVAGAVYNGFIPDTEFLLTKYSGLDTKDMPPDFVNQFYSPRFMLNTLQTLYEDPERFPNIIECLLQAQPNNYFRQKLEGRYDVAQKYGQFSGLLNTAGIIYTPTPIILVVMTRNVEGNMELIGDMAELFANYSLTLDERIKTREDERLAAEEAERLAIEEAAIAEKAAEEAERQRIAAEEEAQRLAEEEAQRAEEARLAEEAQLAAAKEKRSTILLAGGGAVVFLVLLFLLLPKRKKHKRRRR